MAEIHLCEDPWVIHNTLPYVIPYLGMKDLLNASKTCELWDLIIQGYLKKTYVPVCYIHKDNMAATYGSKISRLQLIDDEYARNGLNTKRVTMVSLRVSSGLLHSRQSQTTTKSEKNQHKEGFFEKLQQLTHLKFFTSYRLIFTDQPYQEYSRAGNIYWSSLLKLQYLTYLELGLHIPAKFGLNVLQYLINLEVLKLHLYTGVDESLFMAVSHLKRVEELAVIKTAVNEDFINFLPRLTSMEKLTILIRAPCDTNYASVIKTIIKLNQTLKYFWWILNDVTISEVFFGHNCQKLLSLNDCSSLNEDVIKLSLSRLCPHTKITVEIESEFRTELKKGYKQCYECVLQNSTLSYAHINSYDIGQFL